MPGLIISSRRKNYKDTVLSIRYEDLLTNPEQELRRVFNYLELPFYQELMHHFNKTQLKGRLGDPKGTKQYHSISKVPLEKWKHTLRNPFRKMWCRRYLKSIGHENIVEMGYNPDMLLSELRASPFSLRFLISDILINTLVRIQTYRIGYRTFFIKLKYKLFR